MPWRALVRLLAIAALLVLLWPLHALWRGVGRNSPWPRRFLRGAGRAAGLRVRVEGGFAARDVLFVANHTSWLDILALAGATGTAFVAKGEMTGWPLLGWLARLNNTLFVDRAARASAAAQVGALRAALATGRPLTLFPEGTTGDGVALLPFRSSLLAAVAPPPPGLTIQPVAIDYGPDAARIAWTDDVTIGANAIPLLARRAPIPVTLRFLPALHARDRKALAAEAQAAIAAALRRG